MLTSKRSANAKISVSMIGDPISVDQYMNASFLREPAKTRTISNKNLDFIRPIAGGCLNPTLSSSRVASWPMCLRIDKAKGLREKRSHTPRITHDISMTMSTVCCTVERTQSVELKDICWKHQSGFSLRMSSNLPRFRVTAFRTSTTCPCSTLLKEALPRRTPVRRLLPPTARASREGLRRGGGIGTAPRTPRRALRRTRLV